MDDRSGAILEQWSGRPGGLDDGARLRGRVRAQAERARTCGSRSACCSCARSSTSARPLRGCCTSTCSCCSASASRTCSSTAARSASSVPLVYPVLLYLLVRDAVGGPPPARAHGPARAAPAARLARGRARVPGRPSGSGLNVADSNVIDVGYAGVIGADRIVDGDPLYGEGFSDDVEQRRHLRPGQLPALRAVRAGAALERRLGRPARRPRRRDRIRPAGASAGCCCSAVRCGPAARARRSAWRSPTPGRPIPTRRSCSRRTRTTRSWRWPASAALLGFALALGARCTGVASRASARPRSSRRSRWRRCSRASAAGSSSGWRSR